MKLFEVKLDRPFEVTAAPTLEEVFRGMGTYRSREWKIGQPQEDITSELWLNPSHRWFLSRRKDGVGVLQIKPVHKNVVVSVVERRKNIEKQEELSEVLYSLDRPNRINLLLGGMVLGPNMIGLRLYKIVCTTEDNVVNPF